MRRRLTAPLLGALALLPLTGCEELRELTVAPFVDTANRGMSAAHAACDAWYPEAIGNYLPHARCIDTAQDLYFRPLLNAPDLLDQAHASRELIAARLDRGESPAALKPLMPPDDAGLTLTSATTSSPYLPTWHPPSPVPVLPRCAPRYGFSDCRE